jgi:hypothetical protein
MSSGAGGEGTGVGKKRLRPAAGDEGAAGGVGAKRRPAAEDDDDGGGGGGGGKEGAVSRGLRALSAKERELADRVLAALRDAPRQTLSTSALAARVGKEVKVRDRRGREVTRCCFMRSPHSAAPPPPALQHVLETLDTLRSLFLIEPLTATDAAGKTETLLKLVPQERAELLMGLSAADIDVLHFVERTE